MEKSSVMLLWAVIFFIFSFIAGVLGFAGLVAVSAGISQMLFFVFLLMTAITFAAFLLAR